jgi:hypothetical protein
MCTNHEKKKGREHKILKLQLPAPHLSLIRKEVK